MAQGAVKKSGKRSQAVSAKKEAILAAALEAFSQFGIHGTRLEQVAERAGVSKNQSASITTLRKRRCMWLSCSRSSPSGWRR
ncbi:transcriptional regulator RutR [Klebsiella pneumoniae]|uniref:Transcriptional regulator RutR n=1 Tax=Klebsiella pneumoniae TaxID=573 RepID=A0A378BDK4_KLEPN|nr:transcriptional regulator RutR [Klebsiella pneumoniae]